MLPPTGKQSKMSKDKSITQQSRINERWEMFKLYWRLINDFLLLIDSLNFIFFSNR